MAVRPLEKDFSRCTAGSGDFVFRDGLRFYRTKGGLVFCPEFDPGNRKHACPDCMACAFCADARCSACLGQGES